MMANPHSMDENAKSRTTTTDSVKLSTPPCVFESIAPGRLCLFGEHQDYLGLSVIAGALPGLECRIHCRRRQCNDNSKKIEEPPALVVHVPHLQQTWSFNMDLLLAQQDDYRREQRAYQQSSAATRRTLTTYDFCRAALYEALWDGWELSEMAHNYECTSTTTLPLQAGASSSSAFCVAWCHVVAVLAQVVLRPVELAQRAHQAEVAHWGAPGGNMDHTASAVGGWVRVGQAGRRGSCAANGSATSTGTTETASATQKEDGTSANYPSSVISWDYESLGQPASSFISTETTTEPSASQNELLSAWVLVDSRHPKDTVSHLQRCKDARLAIFQKLGKSWQDDTIPDGLIMDVDDVSAIDPPKELDTDDEQVLWKATILNKHLEQQAATHWHTTLPSTLAQWMDQCHTHVLHQALGLSTPRLQSLARASQRAGAWGFKVVGSGGGGCGVAWTSVDNAPAVAEAMQLVGGVQKPFSTWIITAPAPGARIVVLQTLEGDNNNDA